MSEAHDEPRSFVLGDTLIALSPSLFSLTTGRKESGNEANTLWGLSQRLEDEYPSLVPKLLQHLLFAV